MFGDQTRSNIIGWLKIFPFGHLVWLCLILLDKIWMPRNIWSNIVKHFVHLDVACLMHVWYRLATQHVWSQNNVWSCFVVKHFPFGQGLRVYQRNKPTWDVGRTQEKVVNHNLLGWWLTVQAFRVFSQHPNHSGWKMKAQTRVHTKNPQRKRWKLSVL
jgi:hypothetical protein